MNRLFENQTFESMLQNVDRNYRMKMDTPSHPCPMCNMNKYKKNQGWMRKDESILLLSNPPKFQYTCNVCGHIEYRYS